jgi:hypothetical protein
MPKSYNFSTFENVLISANSGTRSPDPPDPPDYKIATVQKILQPGGNTPCLHVHPLIRGCAAPVAARPKEGLGHLVGPLPSVAGPFRGPQIRQLVRSPAATTPHHWVLRVASCFA